MKTGTIIYQFRPENPRNPNFIVSGRARETNIAKRFSNLFQLIRAIYTGYKNGCDAIHIHDNGKVHLTETVVQTAEDFHK